MSFEKEGHIVIEPLDPNLSDLFMELVQKVLDEGALNKLYNLTTIHWEDCIKATTYGDLSWCSIYSFATN